MFALAQEQLEKNRKHSPRRTVAPTLLQGMLVCEQCGYALYRCSTRTSKHLLHYYRCLGSDGYRRLQGPVCTNRPIRQDYLDAFVWDEIIRLLDNPGLIQTEIDRRQEAARHADPFRKRQEEWRREQMRIEKNIERLVTAYQEGLVTLPQLRQRMPTLQKQVQAIGSELQSLEIAAMDEAKYLQLAESLAGFRRKLRSRADTLDTAALGLTNAINAANSGAGDPDATAIYAGTGTGSIYLSSKQTDLAYDSIALSATSSNTADVDPVTSGAYLTAGTAATAAPGPDRPPASSGFS